MRPEWSPLSFYKRLFGSDFQDPNADEFEQNPQVIARRKCAVRHHGPGAFTDADGGGRGSGATRSVFYWLGVSWNGSLTNVLTKPEPIASCVPPGQAPADVAMDQSTESLKLRASNDGGTDGHGRCLRPNPCFST